MADEEIGLVGYTFFRTERSQRIGGGVIVYTKTNSTPVC